METTKFDTNKIIGLLLITGSIAVFVPYTILTIIFEYPDILRQDPGIILTKFNQGGSSLIWTWWAFGITGVLLLESYVLIGQKLEGKFYFIKWATTLGVISGITQIIGLLRWTFVVPVLAQNYVSSADPAVQAATKVVFQAIHQFGGVILGEHIGQLFTIAWTVMIASALHQLKAVPNWLSYFAYTTSFIYLLAQAELFATVMPDFPVWDLAGFLGSTLWLVWLILLGVQFIRNKKLQEI